MSQTIVIVGGGSAGWLTAGIIAAKHSSPVEGGPGTRIILLESPDVANLGVGEGTWPTMRDTLRRIGIKEVDFLRGCDASFKQGSQFIDWHRGQGESYYHPFSATSGYPNINLAAHWQESHTDISFGDAVCAQGRVCDAGRAPKQPQTPEYAFSLNYGYHLNAGKFVDLLQSHCVEKLGVEYQLGHVEQVISAENGDIAGLRLASGETISGDLFVDCTGFAAILIGKHYKIPFVSQKDFLFNDTALAVQAEYATEDAPIASCTKSTAQSAGWIWDIALPSRRGVGHVFSSQHTSTEKAEEELAAYIKADPTLADVQPSPRKISFQPGHRERFWHKNCVAVGVSAGFVEPLEASALILIEKSAEWISEQLPRDSAAMSVVAKRFNDITRQHWRVVIDFLKLHYVLSERRDSDYWRDHCEMESVPESLQESLSLWRSQVPWLYDSNNRIELFSSVSVQFVLYGMGFVTDIRDSRYRHWKRDAEIANRLIRENNVQAENLIASLPTNRDLLNRVRRR
ncbi:MAG: tryptophan halogenase family protein [Halioglobus sp.]